MSAETVKIQKEKLVRDNLHIVKIIAYRVSAALPPHIDVNDLISAGAMGLVESAGRFDPGMGVRFSTYASARVRGAMMDELRAMDWMTRGKRERKKRLDKAFIDAGKAAGRPGDAQAAAAMMGVSIDELHEMLSEASAISAVNPDGLAGAYRPGETPDVIGIDCIKDPNGVDPTEAASLKEIMQALVAAVKGLPEKERILIALYYYDEMTLMEVGSILDLTESRVSQLHAEIMQGLKSRIVGIEPHGTGAAGR